MNLYALFASIGVGLAYLGLLIVIWTGSNGGWNLFWTGSLFFGFVALVRLLHK